MTDTEGRSQKKRRHEGTQGPAKAPAATSKRVKRAHGKKPSHKPAHQSKGKGRPSGVPKTAASSTHASSPVAPSPDSEVKQKVEDIDDAIGKMNGPLLADHFAKQAKKHNKDLTAVELNDLYVPESAFRDTSSWQDTRNLANLPSFLKSQSPKKGESLLSVASEEKSSPHTLVITAAGIRAADLTRSLRCFQTKECAVAKLFAKHIKLSEAKEFVKSTRIGIGVGTPARIHDLTSDGCLRLDRLERIVIDGSHVDQKKRSIFDMKEIFSPLLTFLTRPELVKRYATASKDPVEIIVY
ncbi:hypothetical protein KEM52_005730 [Ascosphaera acerosa]|nr:hypothetical protein KEM52_005730 [Ascosphaera acerosa]